MPGPLAASLWLACVLEPEPLPAAVQAGRSDEAMAAAGGPPIAQLLYDYAFLPEVQAAEQRVRLLVWLRTMEFDLPTLRGLAELHRDATLERASIERAQAQVVASYEPRLLPTYDALWHLLQAGVPLDDPALAEAAEELLQARVHHAREAELLALRLQGVNAVLVKIRDWLTRLQPEQVAQLETATFLLRHRLDPYANPGDFKALLGTVQERGRWGALLQGSYTAEDDHLDLAGLWSDDPAGRRRGPAFTRARTELVVYMVLLEPSLGEALAAETPVASQRPVRMQNPGGMAPARPPPPPPAP